MAEFVDEQGNLKFSPGTVDPNDDMAMVITPEGKILEWNISSYEPAIPQIVEGISSVIYEGQDASKYEHLWAGAGHADSILGNFTNNGYLAFFSRLVHGKDYIVTFEGPKVPGDIFSTHYEPIADILYWLESSAGQPGKDGTIDFRGLGGLPNGKLEADEARYVFEKYQAGEDISGWLGEEEPEEEPEGPPETDETGMFAVGDLVTVIDPDSAHYGKLGRVDDLGYGIRVYLYDGAPKRFSAEQLFKGKPTDEQWEEIEGTNGSLLDERLEHEGDPEEYEAIEQEYLGRGDGQEIFRGVLIRADNVHPDGLEVMKRIRWDSAGVYWTDNYDVAERAATSPFFGYKKKTEYGSGENDYPVIFTGFVTEDNIRYDWKEIPTHHQIVEEYNSRVEDEGYFGSGNILVGDTWMDEGEYRDEVEYDVEKRAPDELRELYARNYEETGEFRPVEQLPIDPGWQQTPMFRDLPHLPFAEDKGYSYNPKALAKLAYWFETQEEYDALEEVVREDLPAYIEAEVERRMEEAREDMRRLEEAGLLPGQFADETDDIPQEWLEDYADQLGFSSWGEMAGTDQMVYGEDECEITVEEGEEVLVTQVEIFDSRMNLLFSKSIRKIVHADFKGLLI